MLRSFENSFSFNQFLESHFSHLVSPPVASPFPLVGSVIANQTKTKNKKIEFIFNSFKGSSNLAASKCSSSEWRRVSCIWL